MNYYLLISKAVLIFIIIYYIIIKSNFLEKNDSYMKENNDLIILKRYDKYENIKSHFYNDFFFRPFLDEVKIISYIYNKKYKLKSKTITNTNVHISFSFNSNYLYQILVLAKSILINSNSEKTFMSFHFLCTPDVNQNNINVLKTLIMNQTANAELIFYNMSNCFINYKTERYSQATYYRLILPIIINTRKITVLFIWNFQNNFELMKFTKKLKQKINITEFIDALENPSLLHNVRCNPKIWFSNYKYRGIHNLEFKRFHNLWYEYASKTKYFNEIKELYNKL